MNTEITWPIASIAISLITAITFIIFSVLRSLVLKRDIAIARRYIESAVSQIRDYKFSAHDLYSELDKLK